VYHRPKKHLSRSAFINNTVTENIETITVLDTDDEEPPSDPVSKSSKSRFMLNALTAFENYKINQQIYVIDAKTCGNIARYFNHSCAPNLFVQNVFVDTHDLRFPWIALFTLKQVKAGTELCWVSDFYFQS
jgi:hypothetical protein